MVVSAVGASAAAAVAAGEVVAFAVVVTPGAAAALGYFGSRSSSLSNRLNPR